MIDRPTLQELLLKRVGDCVEKGKDVIDCERHEGEGEQGVTALLAAMLLLPPSGALWLLKAFCCNATRSRPQLYLLVQHKCT